MNYSKSFLIGRLTRDPELKYTGNGTAVCNIDIANNYYLGKDDHGNKKEATNYFKLVAWSKTAEIAAQYLKRGDPIHVECEPRYKSWEDKEDGKKRSTIEFHIRDLQFLKPKNQPQGNPLESGTEVHNAPESSPFPDEGPPF